MKNRLSLLEASVGVYLADQDVTDQCGIDPQSGTIKFRFRPSGPIEVSFNGGMKVSARWNAGREKRPRKTAQWKRERSGFRR